MYDARMHPEQYSNTLSAEQISQLHKSIHYVCGLAVETLADSSQFPEEWLFKHRWTKGKKDAPTTLPNGSKFVFLTVGGRTSAVVPSVQKKTGPVKKEIDVDGEMGGVDAEDEESKKTPKKGGKRKKATATEEDSVDEDANGSNQIPKKSRSKKGSTSTGKLSKNEDVRQEAKANATKPPQGKNGTEREGEADVKEEQHQFNGTSDKQANKKQKVMAKPQANSHETKAANPRKDRKANTDTMKEELPERRRSGRASKKDVSYAE